MRLNEQRKVFKIHSEILRKSKWNLEMPLNEAFSKNFDVIVSLNDCQLLRWIDELNELTNADQRIKNLKHLIRLEKAKTETSKTKYKIKELYQELNHLKFKADYLLVIMDKDSDYDRANKGFYVNGIKYRRLLGTNGGIKNSTIVYVNEKLYPELKKRIDNGRNVNTKLIPAKLEAYQALVCSGSLPLPMPKGFIVVKDCITEFKDNVITITDNPDGEQPILKYEDNYLIRHNNSDGCGLMLPSYSAKINKAMNNQDGTISGVNVRYAWTKGMIFTFDFIEFAEKVAGTYEITDVWGQKRDIRDAEVVLTESMLKLWSCYNSWEEYFANCEQNHYQFCAAKITPAKLESKRETNYQYLNPYKLTAEQIQELCRPDVDEIKDIMSLDYRKSIVYLAGCDLNEKNYAKCENYIKSLMICKETITDPYILSVIQNNIAKRIERLKTGKILIDANFSIIGGDLFALCQSMFKLPVTGILKAGELYNEYWHDKGAKQLACFRSPMSVANNICKLNVSDNADAAYWFRYIETATILNAFDTTCDRLNGADFDSDSVYLTDNHILVDNMPSTKTIICLQKQAEKIVTTEADIITTNKNGFGNRIGAITNRITEMYDLQPLFAPDTEEYKELVYRIMCGQHFQQAEIDSIKGVISKPMPKYWYSIDKDMTDFEKSICASKKPYFMIYIYPDLCSKYKKYISNANSKAVIQFCKPLHLLSEQNASEAEFLYYMNLLSPVSNGDCTVNEVARHIESEFDDYKPAKTKGFDYRIYKSGIGYSSQKFHAAEKIYTDYRRQMQDCIALQNVTRVDNDEITEQRRILLEHLKQQLDEIIPDEITQTDILLDICYSGDYSSKTLVWAICGDQIIKNLLKKNDNRIYIPMQDSNGDFEVKGKKFRMMEERID